MDETIQLINALVSLSQQCAKVAKLLDNIKPVIKPINIPALESAALPPPTNDINLDEYASWPEAGINGLGTTWSSLSEVKCQRIKHDFTGSSILEVVAGTSVPVGHQWRDTKVSLLSLSRDFFHPLPPNVKIYSSIEEIQCVYDTVLICESLEFVAKPFFLLSQLRLRLKEDGKIFIRFRPWPASNGGFQEGSCNKAYAHLLKDLPSNDDVKFKILRPLTVYDAAIRQAGFNIVSRLVHHEIVDPFFINDNRLLNAIIERTWPDMSKSEAIKLLSISNVDLILTR